MANLGPVSGRSSRGSLTPPVGQVIARYATYGEAQRAVDFLSDNRFPVQAVTIVGTDLRTVERVTGRLSYGRVALAGALSGAWFGLFVGLVLSLFAEGPDAGVFAAVLIGAGFGMLFGVISYAATGGRRDFTSQSAIIAAEYQLMCRDEQARAAIEVLGRLPHANRAVPPPAPPGPTDPPPTQAPPPAQAAGEAPGTSSRQDTIGSPVPPPGFQRPTDNPYAPPPGWGRPADDAPAPTAAPGAPGTAGGVTEAADGDPGATPSSPPAPIGPTYGEIMEQRRREQREREAAERVARAEAARLAAEAAAEGQDAAPRD